MRTRLFEIVQILFLVALVIVIFGLALALGGCRSTPAIPQIEYQEVAVPQPCVVGIEPLKTLELPQYPPFDPNDPKEWALQVEKVAKQREAMLQARVNALTFKIDEHNKLEPKCAQ